MAVDPRIHQVVHLEERIQLDGGDVVGVVADKLRQGRFADLGQLVWAELELMVVLVPEAIRISGHDELFSLGRERKSLELNLEDNHHQVLRKIYSENPPQCS